MDRGYKCKIFVGNVGFGCVFLRVDCGFFVCLKLCLYSDLQAQLGKGFRHSNIKAMRIFYLQNPILQAVPAKLGWTILVALQKIEDPLEHNFYQQQTELENWKK